MYIAIFFYSVVFFLLLLNRALNPSDLKRNNLGRKLNIILLFEIPLLMLFCESKKGFFRTFLSILVFFMKC